MRSGSGGVDWLVFVEIEKGIIPNNSVDTGVARGRE